MSAAQTAAPAARPPAARAPARRVSCRPPCATAGCAPSARCSAPASPAGQWCRRGVRAAWAGSVAALGPRTPRRRRRPAAGGLAAPTRRATAGRRQRAWRWRRCSCRWRCRGRLRPTRPPPPAAAGAQWWGVHHSGRQRRGRGERCVAAALRCSAHAHTPPAPLKAPRCIAPARTWSAASLTTQRSTGSAGSATTHRMPPDTTLKSWHASSPAARGARGSVAPSKGLAESVRMSKSV